MHNTYTIFEDGNYFNILFILLKNKYREIQKMFSGHYQNLQSCFGPDDDDTEKFENKSKKELIL